MGGDKATKTLTRTDCNGKAAVCHTGVDNGNMARRGGEGGGMAYMGAQHVTQGVTMAAVCAQPRTHEREARWGDGRRWELVDLAAYCRRCVRWWGVINVDGKKSKNEKGIERERKKEKEREREKEKKRERKRINMEKDFTGT